MSIKISIGKSKSSKKNNMNFENNKIQNKRMRESKILRIEENRKSTNILRILRELNSLVGLKNIKGLVEEIYAYVEIRKRRMKENLKTDSLVLHMVFSGNPGTGKTTVARIVAQLFKELEILSKGHVIEVERADLVGEYIGHTAVKTKEQVKKALGGVLFIDEAYSLARGGDKDFGREAIDLLVKAMEDHRDNFILILAGYKKEMEIFIRSNPGLRSRIPIHIDFPDYNLNELMDIAKLMLEEREYALDSDGYLKLKKMLEQKLLLGQNKLGNARFVRNIIEKSIRMQAIRLLDKNKEITRDDLITITNKDIYDCS